MEIKDQAGRRLMNHFAKRMANQRSKPAVPVMCQWEFDNLPPGSKSALTCNVIGCTRMVCTHGSLCVEHHTGIEAVEQARRDGEEEGAPKRYCRFTCTCGQPGGGLFEWLAKQEDKMPDKPRFVLQNIKEPERLYVVELPKGDTDTQSLVSRAEAGDEVEDGAGDYWLIACNTRKEAQAMIAILVEGGTEKPGVWRIMELGEDAFSKHYANFCLSNIRGVMLVVPDQPEPRFITLEQLAGR